tara:strand:- start:7223 stop:7459 length:237 start_codon:yes stop_codon:yes gene_type:complete
MNFEPKVNDYVVWTKGVEGWVYFVDNEYITIETNVWEKSKESYEHSPIHRNDRVLVLCYSHQWNELTYVKSRKSVYEE